MPKYRSHTTTQGRNMAGARALWRATGMKDDDFNKPMIAIANSYTQFVPGHVHLKDMGDLVAAEIAKARRYCPRVPHHCGGRRYRYGSRRHALLAALARCDCRLGRIYGQCPLRRCAGVYFQLRQDYSGHVDGGDAPEHSGDLCLRRPHGSR